MDVILPDGTLLQGIPDGTSQSDIAAKLKANGRDVPDSWLKQDKQSQAKPSEPYNYPQAASDNMMKGVAGALGTPMNTTMNVANLGIAGTGAAMGAMGAKAENLPNLIDPHKQPLSTAWIEDKMKKYGLIGNTPEATTIPGKIAQTGMQMLGGAMVPMGGAAGGAGAAGERVGAEQVAKQSGALRQGLDKDVARLTSEGVPLTVGQTLGGRARALEEKAKSQPILGDAIKEQENRGLQGFNTAVANRVLEPLGEKAPKNLTGNALVDHVGDRVNAPYEELLPKMKGSLDGGAARAPKTPGSNVVPFRAQPPAPGGAPQVPVGQPGATAGGSLRQDLDQIRKMGASIPSAQRDLLNHVLDQEVLAKFTPNGGLASGRTLKDIESQLGSLAKGYRSSRDPYDRQLGGAIQEVQASLRRMVARENPEFAPALQKANQAWSNWTRYETAAGQLGKKEEQITPAMLDRAVRAGDSSMRKGAYARGDAQMQDLSSAGKNVLSPQIANSGTIDRGLVGKVMDPRSWPGMALGSFFYSPSVQGAAQRALTRPSGPGMNLPAGAIPGAMNNTPNNDAPQVPY